MARIDDGELYLEIEGSTEEQLRSGLVAARRHIVGCGAQVGRAMRAEARREEHLQNLLVWEATRHHKLRSSGSLNHIPVTLEIPLMGPNAR